MRVDLLESQVILLIYPISEEIVKRFKGTGVAGRGENFKLGSIIV